MDIAVKKLELLDWIMHLEDTTMFDKLFAMKAEIDENRSHDIVAYNSVGEPLDASAYRAHVAEGLKDAKDGRISSHDDFLNEVKNW